MEAWFKKRYKVIKANKAKFFGETDTKKHIIKINVKKSKKTGVKGELLDSLNHERLHALHPKRNDGKKFDKSVKQSTAKLSKKTKSKLYKLLH